MGSTGNSNTQRSFGQQGRAAAGSLGGTNFLSAATMPGNTTIPGQSGAGKGGAAGFGIAPQSQPTPAMTIGGDISKQPGYQPAWTMDKLIAEENRRLKPGNVSAVLSQLTPFESKVFGANQAFDYNPIDPSLFSSTVSPEQRAKNAQQIYNIRNNISTPVGGSTGGAYGGGMQFNQPGQYGTPKVLPGMMKFRGRG